uniref:Thioredoxin domain-containing protein n=1 Tax=Timspurckia oligopyrenoides TaxID=708627 RepID=A0A7S1EQ52_9RHOD|mmetsp:Transcript_11158/g.20156  ORF Transcript_11158/g.20156 Transcript_11158/m.20156 type:complete len:457 (+) Transcript_11158:48-1418(+)
MKLSQYDVFRKPRELVDQSTLGGLISLGCIFTIILLVFMEIWSFVSAPEHVYIAVDTNIEHNLKINFDISIFSLPCQMVDIEVWDSTGVSKMHTERNFKRIIAFGDRSQYQLGEATSGGHIDGIVPSDIAERVFHDNSKSLTVSNAKQLLKASKFAFVDFYTPWCVWCERLFPHWAALAHYLQAKNIPVTLYKVNCDDQQSLCAGLVGFPTLRFFVNGQPIMPDYQGNRTVEAMTNWLEMKTLNGKSESASAEISEKVKQNFIREENLAEGCRIVGDLNVSRVPGNFHVIAHGRVFDLNPRDTNMSHRINHFSFGEDMPENILNRLPKAHSGKRQPFDGKEFLSEKSHISFDHYLKVISAHYEIRQGLFQQSALGYLMSSSTKTLSSEPEIPEIRFSYDLSPTSTIITNRTTRTWYDFLTNLFALIGGVYMIGTAVDNTLHTLMQRRTKDRQGKLG